MPKTFALPPLYLIELDLALGIHRLFQGMMMFFPRKVSLLPRLFALLFVAAAAQAQPVSSELTIARIVAQPDGSQRLAPASEVGPGDLLQYTAAYRNTGQHTVRRLAATLPIPVGTEFVGASAVPGNVLASVGGQVFEPVPLMRKLKRADGQVVDAPVPLAEYRALRWPERELAAGASYVTSARVRVTSAEGFAPRAARLPTRND